MVREQEQKQELPPLSFSSPIPKTVSIDNGLLGSTSKDRKKSTSLSRLEFGAATPGTMATTSSFVSPGDDNENFNNNNYNPSASPLGIFASFALSSSRTLFGDNNMSSSETSMKAKKRLVETSHDSQDEDDDDDAFDEAKSTLQSTPSPVQEHKQEETQRLGISAPAYTEEDDESVNSADSNRIGIERTNYQIPDGDIPLSPMDPFLQRKKQNVKAKTDSDHDDDGHDLWQLKLRQQANRMNGDTIIEEDEDEDEPVNDSVERFLHEPTAQGRYLVNSRPLDAPLKRIQYPLTEGKAAMSPQHRRASKSKKLLSKTRPNVTVEQQQLQQRSPSSVPITGSPSSSASFKIFILLVAPKYKIFEIIQVFFAPLETTVHHLIQCIPPNATEPALASQPYVGMCRLDGQPLDIDMMASAASPTAQKVECAKIIRGEVLVAIPKGYSARFCSQIAKPILHNPKVTKLMKKSDPLAPSKKKKKKRSPKSSSLQATPHTKYKSIEVKSETAALTSPYASRSTAVLHQTPDLHERRLLKALQRGASEAESTNAEIYSSSSVIMTRQQLDDSLDIDAFEDDDQQQQDHHHLPMELWQTQMSFRSDSSSAASSVDSAFFGSPTSFASPSFRRSSYNNNNANYTGGVAPIPEAHLESPTLGLDIEVVKSAEAPRTPALDRVDTTTNPSASPSPNNNNDSMIDLATLQSTLANKDVHGAMEAFGKLLLQNSMLTPNNTTDQEQQNAIMAQLVRAVQQRDMER